MTKTYPANLAVSAIQSAMPVVLALKECDPELRGYALELFQQLNSGELDGEQRDSTLALIAEILFPNADGKGLPGLDLEEAERLGAELKPEADVAVQAMDRDEATFAEQVGRLMMERGLTQSELAEKVGIGQSAVSMMLARACRPQRKTVKRFADALGVKAEEIWPSMR